MSQCQGPHWPVPPPRATFQSVKPKVWNLCADCAFTAFLGGAHIVPLPAPPSTLRPSARVTGQGVEAEAIAHAR